MELVESLSGWLWSFYALVSIACVVGQARILRAFVAIEGGRTLDDPAPGHPMMLLMYLAAAGRGLLWPLLMIFSETDRAAPFLAGASREAIWERVKEALDELDG